MIQLQKADKDNMIRVPSSSTFGDVFIEQWQQTTDEGHFTGITFHQKGQLPIPDAVVFETEDIPALIEVLERLRAD